MSEGETSEGETSEGEGEGEKGGGSIHSTAMSRDYAEAEAEIESYEVDPDQVKTVTESDRHISFVKEEVVKRARLLDRSQDDRKAIMDGWRDVIKTQKENLEASMDRLSALEDRRRVLAASDVEE